MWSKLTRQSQGGKVGSLDGLNLFFGALLGANLGTLDRVPLFDYVKLVILLAGTAMTIRMISTSRERLYILVLVAFYGALLWALFAVPDLQPDGMSRQDLERLLATLGIWVTLVVLLELTPVRDEPEGSGAQP